MLFKNTLIVPNNFKSWKQLQNNNHVLVIFRNKKKIVLLTFTLSLFQIIQVIKFSAFLIRFMHRRDKHKALWVPNCRNFFLFYSISPKKKSNFVWQSRQPLISQQSFAIGTWFFFFLTLMPTRAKLIIHVSFSVSQYSGLFQKFEEDHLSLSISFTNNYEVILQLRWGFSYVTLTIIYEV